MSSVYHFAGDVEKCELGYLTVFRHFGQRSRQTPSRHFRRVHPACRASLRIQCLL